MKHLNQFLMLCLILMCTFTSGAQAQSPDRAKLFRNTSQNIPVKAPELEEAFIMPEGSFIRLQFKNWSFEGVVTASVKKYEVLHNVLLKSATLDNTVFSISKRIQEDKSIIYTGRILNHAYADGYVLNREEDGTYVLNKIEAAHLLEH